MKQIWLSGAHGVGLCTLVDDADYLMLTTMGTWHLSTHGYAVRKPWKSSELGMHRVVMGLRIGDTLQIDHRDRNRLNNQRHNLALVTNLLNAQNQGSREDSSSHYRGVYWNAHRQKWYAQSYANGKSTWLGSFDTEDAAGAAVRSFRTWAVPNSEEWNARLSFQAPLITTAEIDEITSRHQREDAPTLEMPRTQEMSTV